jgi:hypothetical protein
MAGTLMAKPALSMFRRAHLESSPDEVSERTDLRRVLVSAEQQAREVLAADGVSPDGLVLIWPDGTTADNPPTFAEAQAIVTERGPAQAEPRLAVLSKREDAIGGAARVLTHVAGLRRALAAGDAARAAYVGMLLARDSLILELEIKGWPRAVAAGIGTSKGGKAGGRATRAKDPDRAALRECVRVEAAELLARGWRLGKAQLAIALGKKHDLNAETVRDWLKGMSISGG